MRCALAVFAVAVGCSNSGSTPRRSSNDDLDGIGGTGAANSEEGDNPAVDAGRPRAGQKRVFVTSSGYAGDLRGSGRGADGLAGADNLCQTSANAALLGGTWKAWLSSGAPNQPASNAVDRIADVGPWYRLDGEKAFNNKANLMTGPLVALNVDENAHKAPHGTVIPVWTGTRAGGTWSGEDCSQWLEGITLRSAVYGRAETLGSTWTDAGMIDCGGKHSLYCFEQ
jgi:hypothetical protein